MIPLYAKNSTSSGYVELLDHMGEDGLTCVNAARVSFNKKSLSFSSKDEKLLNYLLTHKHTSVFEHNLLTFSFKVPLFVARQHMRHRTWSFNEISRRYTSLDLDFYTPEKFRTQHKTNRQASTQELIDPQLSTVQGVTLDWPEKASQALIDHNKSSLALYNNMLDKGICREQARMVLPQNLYTHYWGTVNLNNFIKFIDLRDHEGAQLEIQEMARACKQLVQQIWPNIIELYEKNKEKNA